MSGDVFAATRQRIQKEMASSGIPSMAVAVARRGEVIWEEAWGWADVEKRIPATPHTPYGMASVSKPITATAIMKLVEQGKLDLDRPVNDFLGRDSQLRTWIGDPADVTLRRLASHRAGLPLHMHSFASAEISKKPVMPETIRRYGNVVTVPGERYRYSNLGYGVLDHLIERQSGMSYAEFLKQEIFLPLGMTRSSVEDGPEHDGSMARRYGEDRQSLPWYDVDHRGASSVCCSAHDLLRFGMFHLGQCPCTPPILSEHSLTRMHARVTVMGTPNPSDHNLRPGSGYGIGWVIDDDELDSRISHGGGMGGVSAKLLLLPKESLVVVAMANTFCPLPYLIERDILSALLPGYADQLAEFDRKRAALPVGASRSERPIPELLGDWRGKVHTYQGDLPFALSFKPSGDVHARLSEQLPTLVNDLACVDGWISGKMAGHIETDDVCRRPYHPYHHVQLDLKLREDRLTGALVQIMGDSLGHWVELHRA